MLLGPKEIGRYSDGLQGITVLSSCAAGVPIVITMLSGLLTRGSEPLSNVFWWSVGFKFDEGFHITSYNAPVFSENSALEALWTQS